jgi:hypothetical protein
MKVKRMITTGAANAVIHFLSIGMSMAHRKIHAGRFPKRRLKRYERWRPKYSECCGNLVLINWIDSHKNIAMVGEA